MLLVGPPGVGKTRLAIEALKAAAAGGAVRWGDRLRIARRLDEGIPTDPELLLEAVRQSLRAFDFDAAARLGRAAWDER